MRIYVITFLSTCLLFFLTALSEPNEKIGHIFKVDIELGDTPAKNVQTDEFWPLSLEELSNCVEIAVSKTLEK